MPPVGRVLARWRCHLEVTAQFGRRDPENLACWSRLPQARRAGHVSSPDKPASTEPLQVSFYNLVEAHVLRALRTEHGVALAEFRKAIAYAQKKLQLHRLLLSPELRTHAGQVFLDRYVELINLSASGQLVMRKMFEDHLQRVEWDEWQFPVRLHPYVDSTQRAAERPIAIDPHVAFGRPIVRRAGISTAAIADRIDAGETVDALADDYDL